MGLVVRLYEIVSPHDFRIYIKESETPYPLDTGYIRYHGAYSGGTTQIELSDPKEYHFEFNTQYWIKIVDTITNRYINENVYIHDQVAFAGCVCNPPTILSAYCYLDELDCDLTLTAVVIP